MWIQCTRSKMYLQDRPIKSREFLTVFGYGPPCFLRVPKPLVEAKSTPATPTGTAHSVRLEISLVHNRYVQHCHPHSDSGNLPTYLSLAHRVDLHVQCAIASWLAFALNFLRLNGRESLCASWASMKNTTTMGNFFAPTERWFRRFCEDKYESGLLCNQSHLSLRLRSVIISSTTLSTQHTGHFRFETPQEHNRQQKALP